MNTAGYTEPVPPMVSILTGGWQLEGILSSAPSSGAFEGANKAAYYPLVVPSMVVVRRLWWVNGSTVSASYHLDVGIYSDVGHQPATRLLSTGSTAQGTASQVQFVDITDTTLPPARYWLAIACDTVSATLFRSTYSWGDTTRIMRYEQTSAFALPATATPAATWSSQAYLFGFATTASP